MAESIPVSEGFQKTEQQNQEPQIQRQPPLNVGEAERYGSIASGAALVLAAIARRGVGGLILGGLGAMFIQRGLTGHCALYERMGITSAPRQRHGVPGSVGVKVERSITINRPAAEIFRFVRDARNLPKFMKHLERVDVIDEKHSHWVAKSFSGRVIEWDVEIVNEHPDELLTWESAAGSPVPNAGTVRLKAAPNGRGTEVRIAFEVYPPAGMLGVFGAKLVGATPEQEVEEDLAMLKQVSETGEVATTKGQPMGRH